MNHDFLADISDFIFISDSHEKADIIFIPGGSYPELPEYAARLYKEGYAPLILPSGRFSIKLSAFLGSRSNAELYHEPYQTEFQFMEDVLIKNDDTLPDTGGIVEAVRRIEYDGR